MKTILSRGVAARGVAAVVVFFAGVAVFAEDAYIESSGAQYIQTGYCANPLTKIVCDFAYTTVTPVQQRIFGEDSDDSGSGVTLSCSSYINGNGYYAWAFCDGTGNWTSTGVLATTDRRVLILDSPGSQASILTGGAGTYSVKMTTTRTATASWPLMLFACNRSADHSTVIGYARARLYSFAVYEGRRLVHYYKPYRSADASVIGLKDLVTGEILQNAGTGTFTCGGDISDAPAMDLDGIRIGADGRNEFRVNVESDAGGGVTATRGGVPVADEFWVPADDTAVTRLVATPDDGAYFWRWTGDTDCISSGSDLSSQIDLSVSGPMTVTAHFVVPTSSVVITNAFDLPKGGFASAMHANVPVNGFSNTADRVISFAAPADAPAGLREFFHASPSITGMTEDWGFFTSFSVAQSATTQAKIRLAEETAATGLTADKSTCTYAGSWYVPTNAVYSFRMQMRGSAQLVIDNAIILQQNSSGSLGTTNGVALAQGWHNLYVVLLARNVSGTATIGPAGTAPGILYSPVNADLSADPSVGFTFGEQEDGHAVSTAFNGVLVPSMWAAGCDVIIDCANALGDLRVAGQLGADSNGRYQFLNLPAGRTLEVGRPCASPSLSGDQSLDNESWIDWTRTALPDGVKIRLEGMVVVNSLPAGHEWSLGRRVRLATDVADIFGVVASDAETFTLPPGVLRLTAGRPQVLGTKAKIVVPAGRQLSVGGAKFEYSNGRGLPFRYGFDAFVFPNDIELAGADSALSTTPVWDAALRVSGAVLGAEGQINITGWGRRVNLNGPVYVGSASAGQRGCRIMVQPRAGVTQPSRIGTVKLSDETSAKPSGGWNYCGATLFYCPFSEGQPPLSVGTLTLKKAGYYPAQTTFRRTGSTLSVCSNNTVNVTTLSGVSGHLRTVYPAGSSTDVAEIDRGFGNVVVGTISQAMKLYISPRVNLTVTNVALATTFDYSVTTGTVNNAVLDIEGTCTASTIKATDIAMLPARVKGFVGNVELTETEGKTYPVTLDFSASVPNHGGCDGSGTLVAAPANGALDVAITGDAPAAGEYGLVRFSSVGTLLDNWTVSATPTFYKGYELKLVRDATGIWMKVTKSGTMVIFR